ncbi:MAG: DUF4270 domain-containing protein [Bacteroidales bacterium]|nr:DUF4270 domain-containing protein [Bacteroidales bacterium]MCM1147940.1 DUF4270 domain-containing protein [Bacteroidales bacterium]MCM1205489.1 DUF4270 domain-containing protein [Bacillota bacterium]MCM1509250.1 DUF4270 domain-containing protein [Clostridium sp.]
MKKKGFFHFHITFCSLFAAIFLMTACDDTTETLGSSITNIEDVMSVSDAVYKVTSQSVRVDSIIARSSTRALGIVKDPETGTYIQSNLLTQFHVIEDNFFYDEDSLPMGREALACGITFNCSSFYGDSLQLMKATLYELNLDKPLEEGKTYYSNIDPIEDGYVRPDGIKVSKVFSIADCDNSDSVRQENEYSKYIYFDLNSKYTDPKDPSKTYSNYGTYLLTKYFEDKTNFKNSYNFIHRVCPGFYVKMENGLGCMAYINSAQLSITFQHGYNKVARIFPIYATDEVKQLTEVITDTVMTKELIKDNNCTYIKSPTGVATLLTLPVEEICEGHENDSINSAKVTMKCYGSDQDSKYTFRKPSTLLMLEQDSLTSFFTSGKIADNRKSYVASYSGTTNGYTFNNIGQLVKTIYRRLPADATEREEYKRKHPNWDKVLLVPVTANYTTYNSTSILSSVTPDTSLSTAKLVGGPNNPGAIEISVVYSRYTR